MGSAGGEPRVLLNALKPMLGVVGDIKTKEVVRIIGMMKDTEKLMSRCIYLNVLRSTCEESLLHSQKKETVQVFLNSGGWGVLNKWLSESVKSENNDVLLELMDVLKMLPVTVDLLKQGNTGKLVKSMTKFQHLGVKKSAAELMEKWYALVKKKHVKKPNVAVKDVEAKAGEKSDATLPTDPSTKLASSIESERIKKRVKNIKERFAIAKEKKLIADSGFAADSCGFMAALNISAPAPKKRRVACETKASCSADKLMKESFVNQGSEDSSLEPTKEKESSMELGTDPAVTCPDTKEKADKCSATRKKNKKGLSIHWAPEDQLVQVQYIEPRVTKNSCGGNETFSHARQMELLFEKQSMAAAHTKEMELMEWSRPIAIDDTTLSGFIPGERSIEKGVQMQRQKSIISTIFLFKHSIPDSPTEPDDDPVDLKSKRNVVIIPQTFQEEKKEVSSTNSWTSASNCSVLVSSVTPTSIPAASVPATFIPATSVSTAFVPATSIPAPFLPPASVSPTFVPGASVPVPFLPPASHPVTFVPATSAPANPSTFSVDSKTLEKLKNILIPAPQEGQPTSSCMVRTDPHSAHFPQQPSSHLKTPLKHPLLGIPLPQTQRPPQNIINPQNMNFAHPLVPAQPQRAPLHPNVLQVNRPEGPVPAVYGGHRHDAVRPAYPVKNPSRPRNNVTSEKQYTEHYNNNNNNNHYPAHVRDKQIRLSGENQHGYTENHNKGPHFHRRGGNELNRGRGYDNRKRGRNDRGHGNMKNVGHFESGENRRHELNTTHMGKAGWVDY